MTFGDRLVSTTPREGMGGTVASARFEYQLNWALLKLLELYRLPDQFLLLLDYHDDVVVCDAEESPTQADFYQVKTKGSGNWTITRLLQRLGSGDGLSFLGKLYDHRHKFGPAVRKMELVSNAAFSLRRADGAASTAYTQMCCMELDEEEVAKIRDALVAEHGLENEPEFKEILFFHVSPLPVVDFDTHVKGVLVDYFEDRNPGRSFRIRLIHKTLLAELRRKNNNTRLPTSFEELASNKGIGRSTFDAMMSRVVATHDPQERWNDLELRLERSGVPWARLRGLRGEYMRASAELLDFTNFELNRAYTEVRSLVASVDESVPDMRGVLEWVRTRFRHSRFDVDIYRDAYVDALTLHAMNEL